MFSSVHCFYLDFFCIFLNDRLNSLGNSRLHLILLFVGAYVPTLASFIFRCNECQIKICQEDLPSAICLVLYVLPHVSKFLVTCSRWLCFDWAISWLSINNGHSIVATSSSWSTLLKIIIQTSRGTIVYYPVHVFQISTNSKRHCCKFHSNYPFLVLKTL